MVSLANTKTLLEIARKQEETSGSSTAEKIDHPSIADYICKAECFCHYIGNAVFLGMEIHMS